MELRVLRYFIEVARMQNITAAAEKLHITQPTLSKQLIDLENELGTSLLNRGKRKTTLTDDGILLYQRAKEIVELADKAEDAFRSTDDRIAGDISIGCGETEGMKIVIEAMKRMREAHKDVRFHLFSGNYEDVSAWLDSGLVDFGLFVGDAPLEVFDYVRLPYSDTWGLLMRDDCPLAERKCVRPSDLDQVPLLCSRQALYRNELSGWLGHSFSDLDIVSTHNLVHNSVMMAQAGMGCVVTLSGLVNTTGTNLVFAPFEPALKADLVFARKRSRQLSKAASAFLQTVLDVIA